MEGIRFSAKFNVKSAYGEKSTQGMNELQAVAGRISKSAKLFELPVSLLLNGQRLYVFTGADSVDFTAASKNFRSSEPGKIGYAGKKARYDTLVADAEKKTYAPKDV